VRQTSLVVWLRLMRSQVDAMTIRMVQKPKTLDTIVTTNLHGE
jgi:isocitrate/isopropylmalate dehydrogenase